MPRHAVPIGGGGAALPGPVQRAMWERGVIAFRATAIERKEAAEVTVFGMIDT